MYKNLKKLKKAKIIKEKGFAKINQKIKYDEILNNKNIDNTYKNMKIWRTSFIFASAIIVVLLIVIPFIWATSQPYSDGEPYDLRIEMVCDSHAEFINDKTTEFVISEYTNPSDGKYFVDSEDVKRIYENISSTVYFPFAESCDGKKNSAYIITNNTCENEVIVYENNVIEIKTYNYYYRGYCVYEDIKEMYEE